MAHDEHGNTTALMPGVDDEFPIGRQRGIVAFAEDFLASPIRLNAGHLGPVAVLAENNALAARRFLPTRHVAYCGRAIEPAHFRAIGIRDPQIRRAFTI